MPIYDVQAADGKIYSVEAPEGTPQEQIFAFVQSQMGQINAPALPDYSKMSTQQLEAAKSAPTSISDIARSLGIGVVGGAKSIADVFGAGSDVSEYLGETVSGLQKGLTPARQAEIARRQELEKRAAESGSTLQEIKTFLGGVAEAPIQSLVQGVGSSAPTILASLAAIPAGAPASLALGVGVISRYALGAAQGVGELKGSILDEVEQAYIKAGYDKEQARELALKAQEYSADKALQMGGAALLGALDAFTGIESGVSKAAKAAAAKKLAGETIGAGLENLPEKALARPTVIGSAARSALGEAPLEGAQGGYGEYAKNLALIQEGLLDPQLAMQGVFGAAARDAAIGALTGGAFTPVEQANRMREYETDQALRQQKELGEIEAIRKGLEEAEKPEELPGGYKIQREELGTETVPAGFSIMAEGREEPLSVVDTEEEAKAKLESLTKIRAEEQNNILKEEEKINAEVDKAQARLEQLEAIEQTNTEEYRTLKARLPEMMDERAQKIQELYDRNQSLGQPLTMVPLGETERVNEQFKITGPDGQTVGTFKTLGEAEAKAKEIVGEQPFKQKQIDKNTLAARAQFIRQLQKFGLGDVGLKIVDQIEGGKAGGAYAESLIRLAYDERNPLQTMRHESLHALKDLGFFTDQQWKALELRAEKEWVQQMKKERYGEELKADGTPMSRYDAYMEMLTKEGEAKGLKGKELEAYARDALYEEAIADAFGAYAKGAKPPPGMIAALFKRLQQFFTNLKQALKGAGFESADDIFQKIERGELKGRKPAAKPAEAEEKLSLAPKGVPQKIWDLHEKARKADEEASGREGRPEGISPGAAKRNQTMTFRRLNQAVMDFVGGDEQKANDLMVKMNEESSRRGEKLSLIRAATPEEIEISTQNPSGPKRAYDPITQMLSIDEKAVMEVMKVNPDYRKATIKAIKGYGFIPDGTKDKDAIPLFKQNIINNLLYLYNLVPEDIRQRSKLWYDGANKISQEMADKYGLSLRQVSAIMAAMSPQKDWFQNVSMGERAIDILTKHGDRSWSPEMLQYAESYVKESKDRAEREKRQEDFEKIKMVAERGTALKDMDIKSAAAFIRAYDEAFHSRQYRIVTPEGGFGDVVRNNDGTPSTMMWSTYGPIEKAVSIFRDGSRENISEQLGFEHKIRSFYNNIAAPKSDLEHVTIDTHAVAAALFEALAGTDPEVVQNFGGTGKSRVVGVGGTYGLIADAYRDAAKQVGVLPREMQSITWEAVRGLFNEDIKNSIKEPVKAEWAKYKSGKQSFEETRRNIIEISRDKRTSDKNVDIPPPDWVGSGEGQFVEDGGESYNKDYIPEGGVRLREEQEIRDKLTFNLSAVTNSIPGLRELYSRALKRDEKAIEVLQGVAQSSLTHLLSGTNARVNIERAKGVYLSDREPSLMVTAAFNESEGKDVLAALARFAKNFNQEQIHVRMGTKKNVGFDYGDGSYVTPVYTIQLKKELSDKDISNIIDTSGLKGFTVTKDNLIAYFVKPNRESGETNEQYAKQVAEAFDQFEEQVNSAYVLAGKKGTTLGRKNQRLFVYGSGYGATVGYESISGNVRPEQSADTVTPRLIAEYLTGEPVQVFKQKDLTKAQVAQQQKLAQTFDTLPVNDLKNPLVKKAYKALTKALKDQFAVLPIKVEIQTDKDAKGNIIPPYNNSSERMRRDILERNHMLVYPTTPETFGPEGYDFSGHPLLEDSGFKDINGKPMLYNDVLRAVHDYFAHGMTEAQFGPTGEYTAWKNHMASTPDPMARWALTAETRLQNAWQNFRPEVAELALRDRPFALQKAALPPVEFLFTGDKNVDAPVTAMVESLSDKDRQGSKPVAKLSLKGVSFPTVKEAKKAVEETKDPDTKEFKQFIGASQWLNEDGSPKRFYHATAAEFFEFTPAGQSQAIFLADTPEEAETFGSIAEDRLRRQIYRALNKDDKLSFFQGIIDKAVADDKITQKQGEDFIKQAKRKMPEYGDFGDIEQETYDALLELSPNRMRIMPLYARAETPFDFENPDHVNNVMNWVANNTQYPQDFPEKWLSGLKGRISQGLWQAIEDKRVQAAIRALGHDGFTVRENRASRKNYAVYTPNQVKSITGNLGDFSLESKDVRYSLREFNKQDLPQKSRDYTLPENTLIFHGAYKERADRIEETGGVLLSRPPMRVSGGATNEGGLIFFGGEETARRYANSEADPMAVKAAMEFGVERLPGKVFKTVTDRPYTLINRYHKINKKEAELLTKALGLPDYKALSEGDPLEVAATRATDYDNSNIDRYEVTRRTGQGKEKISAPWPVIFRALGVDGFFDGFSVALTADNGIRLIGDDGRLVKYSLPSISAADEARMREVVQQRYEPGWTERVIGGLKQDYTGLRQKLLNRYERLAQYDRLLREKIRQAGGPELLADQSAESAALFSDLGAGVTASAMGIGDRQGGIPVYRNGITTVDPSVKGLVASLAPLAKYGDPEIYERYQFWAGWKRGRRLLQEGRERNYTAADAAIAQRFEAAHPEFVQVQKDLNAFNDGIVKYLVDTGVISKERGQVYTQYADYIPFYRQFDLDKTIGPNPFSGISGVRGPKALKGGDAPIGDFMENLVRNTQSAINAGLKNTAAQRATQVAMRLNGPGLVYVERLPGPTAGVGYDVYTVLEKGQLVYYRSGDHLFIDALKSLNMPDLPFMGLLSAPANALRNLVTKDPGFMMANLLRDSLSSYVTSGQNVTPIVGTMVNFGKALTGKNPGMQALFNAGIIGGYEFSQNIEQSGKSLERDLEKKAGKGNIVFKPFKSLWEGLEKGTTASDAATRMAVYERVMKETGNEAEALFRALEVMNFNRKGNSPIIRIATAAIPFFNARLQGLDLFYRASTGKMDMADAKMIQKKFWVRGMTMAALSVMYYFSVAGEDEYEDQEQETKDNNWLFPGLGIRIPIPFEVGVLFKTMPERITAYAFGNDTGEDLAASIKRALVGTFGFNPIPQTFKPLVEVATNYNFFTMRPIVGQGLAEVSPEFQVGPGTSRVAEKLGAATGLSPMKIDQLIKGYTGTIGGYVTDLVDVVLDLNNDSPKAAKRFEQLPIVKRFALDPEARGPVTQFYEMQKAVDTTVRTMNLLERTARPEEFAKFVEDNLGPIAVKDYVRDLEKSMKELRGMKQAIQTASMSGEDKQEALTAIGQAEKNLTRNIQTVKKAISELK